MWSVRYKCWLPDSSGLYQFCVPKLCFDLSQTLSEGYLAWIRPPQFALSSPKISLYSCAGSCVELRLNPWFLIEATCLASLER